MLRRGAARLVEDADGGEHLCTRSAEDEVESVGARSAAAAAAAGLVMLPTPASSAPPKERWGLGEDTGQKATKVHAMGLPRPSLTSCSSESGKGRGER
jgi:hypothetical protein